MTFIPEKLGRKLNKSRRGNGDGTKQRTHTEKDTSKRTQLNMNVKLWEESTNNNDNTDPND